MTPRMPLGMEKPSWTPTAGLRRFGIFIGKKSAIVAAVWVVVYFSTQWISGGSVMVAAPIIGAPTGLILGWWMAQDSVENAPFVGLLLWTCIVAAVWLPIVLVEWLFGEIMFAAAGWQLNFGRWMLLTSAGLFSMSAAVWRAVQDE